MASNPNIEVYTLVLKALQDGPFQETAHVLAKELEKLLPHRYDFVGNTHKITLDEHLKKFPHINGQTLMKICEKLKETLDRHIPPSVNETSFLGDGHQSLLRSEESLRLESIGHAVKSLLASRHYLSSSKHTINICKSLRATKVKGSLGLRNTIPTEFYQRPIRYKRVLCHLSPVYCIAFDRTGQFIFTGADDNLIKIWSAKDGRLLSTLRGHSGEITDISVNYENRLLASGSVDRLIRVWDLRTTKMIECLSAHTAMITSVKFSPYNRQGKERWLVSTSNDGCISFWKYNVDDLKFPSRPIKLNERIKPGGQMVCSSISMGGSFLACGSSDFFVRVYGWHHSISSPYKDLEIELHTDQVDSLQFCNKGYRFVSGSKDGFAIIWSYSCREWHPIRLDMRTQLNEGTENTTQQESADDNAGRNVKVSMIGWTSDDTYVITSLSDNSIKVWNSYTGKLIHVLKEHTEETYIIESHPLDPRIFLSAGHDGRIILWDVERGIPIKSFQNTIEGQGHACIYDCKFSPDGLMFAATDSHGHLSLYGFGSAQPYDALPDQVFFHSDYRPLIRDVHGFVMDEQTHLAPHLMPPPTLVDMNGDPHEDRYQRLVPDFRGEGKRLDVIPPMPENDLKYQDKLIQAFGIAESETHLREMNREGKHKKLPEYHLPPRVTRLASRRRPTRRPARQTARRSNHPLPPRNVVEERNNESFDSSTSSESDDSDYVLPPRARRSRRRRKVVARRRTSRVNHRENEPGPSRRVQEEEEDDEATEIDDEATDIDDGDQTDIISPNSSIYNTRQSRYSQRKRRKKIIEDY